MRVQYFLTIALFLEGHHIAVESGHVAMPHAFNVWLDLSERGLGINGSRLGASCFMQLNHFWPLVCPDACMASLHSQKVLDLRQKWRYVVARRQESGHVSRSVLRTGRKVTLHPFKELP